MERSIYKRWTKDALVGRIEELEKQLKEKDKSGKQDGTENVAATSLAAEAEAESSTEANGRPARRPPKEKKSIEIDPSKYSTRLVAFKFAYLGRNYGGYEYQTSAPLPTIEEELWKAFVTSRLIFPKGNPDEVRWEDPSFEYSKCGRTDRGVSAFGQVICLRVRSARPLPKKKAAATVIADLAEEGEGEGVEDDGFPGQEDEPEPEFDDFTDEIRYCRILNRLLPRDIRMLAWCPTTPSDFSARHSCVEREYRYFFTQPAYPPIPSSLNHPATNEPVKDGWLDIDRMREAAKKFEGLHDFRNFCKIDGSKQLTNFMRRMFESDIVEVKGAATSIPYLNQADFRPLGSIADSTDIEPKVYYFHVRGSAFLWHQIRCMIAVLFTVAQGLEESSIVDTLFDVEKTPRRPNYCMADEVPLVLWDCTFPDSIKWVHVGEESPTDKHSTHGLVQDLWQNWRSKKIDELLASQLLSLASEQSDHTLGRDSKAPRHVTLSTKQFEGADSGRPVGKYVPMARKQKTSTPDEVNDKTAQKKGYKNAVEYRAALAEKREAAIAAALSAASDIETQLVSLEKKLIIDEGE